MIKKISFGIVILTICTSYGPPNCNLYKNDENCHLACLEAEKAVMHSQGSKPSQEHFDKSIALCPTFDYSYYQKSVPFAKRGLIREWKKLIDKAVENDPKEHLSNRGWYHFYFMRNYEAAIKDVEELDRIQKYDIGSTGDAMYHLNIMKGLCWKGLGNTQKAIDIITTQMQNEDHDVGLYDYLHLGVLYLENEEFELALKYLEQQIEMYDLSEVYYYKALAFKKLGLQNECKANLQKALEYYKNDDSIRNSYIELVDEIYLIDIEKELSLLN